MGGKAINWKAQKKKSKDLTQEQRRAIAERLTLYPDMPFDVRKTMEGEE